MAAPRPTPASCPTPRDLAELLGLPGGEQPSDVVVTGVTLDSRTVRPGDLYAALPGASVHGASFVAQARDAGAVALLTDTVGADLARRAGVALPTLRADVPRAVLGGLAARVYGTVELPMAMVGITGTNGKTTTAHLLASALTALGHRTGLIGTVETRIGEERITSVRTTPESPELHAILAVMSERGLDSCVMEVSSHAVVQHRVDGVLYDLALFTNLSQDHLDFHGDMSHYFAAKAALFTPQRSRRGLVCVDDDWGEELTRAAGIPLVTVTTRPDRTADWTVAGDPSDPGAFRLRGSRGGTEIALDLRSALPGDFNVTNTAMAAVTMLLLGEGPEQVRRAVLTDPHVPGRMERVAAREDQSATPLAVVDYAHTPRAVAAALSALRPDTAGVLVVVLGAGGDRDRGKRQAMGAAAARYADVVVVTDDNPRSEDPRTIRLALLEGAAEEARSTGRAVRVLEVAERRDAIVAGVVAAGASPGGTVAVVGKGHESGQELGDVVQPFDDRVELRAAVDRDRTAR